MYPGKVKQYGVPFKMPQMMVGGHVLSFYSFGALNELTPTFLIHFCTNIDSTLHQEEISSGVALPLVLILGYINGFHVWTIPVSVSYLGA